MKKSFAIAIACLAGVATHAEERPFTDIDAMQGKALYTMECSACHGDQGNGQGPASSFLDPLPRDFTAGKFKFRTTPSGEPPRTDDVLKVIERGVPGTAMPSFTFLPEGDRRKIAAYVLAKADLIDAPEPVAIPDPGAPPAPDAASLARGKEVYGTLQCGRCHGELGKGDGPAAETLVDNDERPIKVRDFTVGVFRGGDTPEDLYNRFITGMDGTPMPSFAESIPDEKDRWALVNYVMSLKVKASPTALPADPLEAGLAVAEKYSCRGCHVMHDGKGGEVGPDFRISAQKLGSDWVRTFLKAPRQQGKIYPWRAHRMPHLGLTDEDVDVMVKYLAAVGKRKIGPLTYPDVATFPAAKLEQGKNIFVLRCAQCHALGKVVETPVAAQQGPDLIRASGRVHWDFVEQWVLDPRKIDPKTKMTVPGITPEEVEAVRMFVWKTSSENASTSASAAR